MPASAVAQDPRAQWVARRVREARLAAGLSQAQLAAAVGLDRTALVKVEAGSRSLSVLEAADLAEAVDVPLALLLQPAEHVVPRREPHPGADTDQEPDQLREALLLESWARDVDLLVRLEHLRPASRPAEPVVRTRKEANAAAAALRPYLAPDDEPLGPLAEVGERVGLYVAATRDHSVEGASVLRDGYGAAIVGPTEPGRRRSTGARELAHHLLGDAYTAHAGGSPSTERESLVDLVAVRLLLPLSVVQHAAQGLASAELRAALVRVAGFYRVSWSLALAAAREAEVLPVDDDLQWLQDEPRRAELIHLLGAEVEEDLRPDDRGPQWVRAVASAVRAGDVSRRRAFELVPGWAANDLPEPPPDPGF